MSRFCFNSLDNRRISTEVIKNQAKSRSKNQAINQLRQQLFRQFGQIGLIADFLIQKIDLIQFYFKWVGVLNHFRRVSSAINKNCLKIKRLMTSACKVGYQQKDVDSKPMINRFVNSNSFYAYLYIVTETSIGKFKQKLFHFTLSIWMLCQQKMGQLAKTNIKKVITLSSFECLHKQFQDVVARINSSRIANIQGVVKQQFSKSKEKSDKNQRYTLFDLQCPKRSLPVNKKCKHAQDQPAMQLPQNYTLSKLSFEVKRFLQSVKQTNKRQIYYWIYRLHKRKHQQGEKSDQSQSSLTRKLNRRVCEVLRVFIGSNIINVVCNNFTITSFGQLRGQGLHGLRTKRSRVADAKDKRQKAKTILDNLLNTLLEVQKIKAKNKAMLLMYQQADHQHQDKALNFKISLPIAASWSLPNPKSIFKIQEKKKLLSTVEFLSLLPTFSND